MSLADLKLKLINFFDFYTFNTQGWLAWAKMFFVSSIIVKEKIKKKNG